jgi:Protein of unknown function (DUF1592)/Protein of unknown function (DUF1588)/Protein of unknown function (DUF1595)/Protein of unknown function (DUF1585)
MSLSLLHLSKVYGRTVSAAALLGALAGCTGVIGGPSGGDDSKSPFAPGGPGQGSGAGNGSGGSTTDLETVNCEAVTVDPGPSPMRLLSREQYLNSVRDLVGEVGDLEGALGPSVEASAFGLVQPDITQVALESFQTAADVIAAAVVNDSERLNALAPCDAGAVPRDCAQSFVESFGARAYRAPVTDAADVERHLKLFDTGATTSFAHGIELLLRGLLQSPRFLYRVEIGTSELISERAIKLSPHEIAARLSYTVWNTLPDAKLNDAIASGRLSSKDGVAGELAWMLEDPRGSTLVSRFLESFLHVSDIDKIVKDEAAFPEWQGGLRQALKDQAQSFFDHVLQNQGGQLSALFTSPTVFVNGTLGAFYGVSGDDTFQPLERSDGTASGILTLPAFLALQAKPAESSPIYRGRFVREALLCQTLPAPPANVPKPPEVEPSVSTRERLSQHEVDPKCRGCHQLLDPVGFGFEHYDAIGRYRTTDGDAPVDAQGNLIDTRDIDGPFNGVVELGAKLASSAEVEECIARQWFRYALGRFEQDMDVCSMKSLLESFQAAAQDLNALPRAVVETNAFMYRRPLDFQGSP